MGSEGLPRDIVGQWMWDSSLIGKDDTFLLFRHSFQISTPDLENILWITAGCAYQLFINDSFVGFGPRASNQGTTSYVDRYEISDRLRSGINSLCVVVYETMPENGCRIRPYGLWCQLECGGRIMVKSDESWMIFPGTGYLHPRPRAGYGQLMTEYIDNTAIPPGWSRSMYHTTGNWKAPDRLVSVNDYGAGLELFPMPPAMIENDAPFRSRVRGRIAGLRAWTQVVFNQCHDNRHSACAAETFLFSEKGGRLRFRLSCDSRYRFFVNDELVSHGEFSMGNRDLEMVLQPGWNRLLVGQNPGENSMGVFLLFPDFIEGGLICNCRPDKAAEAGWVVIGPLKLPLEQLSPRLRFDTIENMPYIPENLHPMDLYTLFKLAQMEVSDEAPGDMPILQRGDFLRLSLDILRYGVPLVEVDASEGDIIDLTMGQYLRSNGMPTRGSGIRSTHTLRCREGHNVFMLFHPREIHDIMISVRYTRKGVHVARTRMLELVRNVRTRTSFECADEELNLLWKIGEHTLRRSAAYVPQSEPHLLRQGIYLLDAYIDAVNRNAVFGDRGYCVEHLRQFLAAQYENGDIPVRSFSGETLSQVHHLFFLPEWILYNYRITGDFNELERCYPHLMRTLEFYESLVDPEIGLIGEIDTRFELKSRISDGVFDPDSIPTYVNALFCRFLTTTGEICRLVGDEETAQDLEDEANEVASELKRRNYDPEAKLYYRKTLRDGSVPEPEHNLWANFTVLYSGILSEAEIENFFDTYFNQESPFDCTEEARNPYIHFLFMDTLFNIGKHNWGCRYLREYWQARNGREAGAWLSWKGEPNPQTMRFSDGCVVSPNVFMVRELGGVRAIDPAFTTIFFRPATELTRWASSTVHTASGKLEIRWEHLENGDFQVTVDSSYPVRVLPVLPEELRGRAVFDAGEKVTIMEEEV